MAASPTLRNMLPWWASDALLAAEEVAVWLGVPEQSALLAVTMLTGVLMLLLSNLVGRMLDNRIEARKQKARGGEVVLLGLCGAGKTCMFFRLKADEFPECVTSMEPNSQLLRIAVGQTNEVRARQVVDFPGHARLRGDLPLVLGKAGKVVFVVDSADKSPAMIVELAELMYDVFSEFIRSGRSPRVLVACNKQDLPGARDPAAIKALLEKELDSLKTTRHSLETEGAEGSEIMLGTEGAPFEFDSDAGCEVEFCEASVKEGGAKLDAVLDFVLSTST